MITTLLSAITPLRRRRPARLGACVVCHASVTVDDEHVRLRGGGWVHRRCATYRMRRRLR
jgi:hypothetical protein